MIKVYLSPSCASCRKVRAWFKSQKIPFEEINILKDELTEDELKEILNKSLDGTDEIISTRSKIFKEQHINVDDMSVKDLLAFIKANPTILKRPIIVDDKIIQVGYNSDEIEIFERAKKIASTTCTAETCPNFGTCLHHYDDKKNAVTEQCEEDGCK